MQFVESCRILQNPCRIIPWPIPWVISTVKNCYVLVSSRRIYCNRQSCLFRVFKGFSQVCTTWASVLDKKTSLKHAVLSQKRHGSAAICVFLMALLQQPMHCWCCQRQTATLPHCAALASRCRSRRQFCRFLQGFCKGSAAELALRLAAELIRWTQRAVQNVLQLIMHI